MTGEPGWRRGRGATGPRVSALGLGCTAMSGMYGPSDYEDGIATIRAARDAGVTLLDTCDFYGMGHTRERLAEALGALDVRLSDEDVARIERAVPPGSAAGERYREEKMAMLDSERRA